MPNYLQDDEERTPFDEAEAGLGMAKPLPKWWEIAAANRAGIVAPPMIGEAPSPMDIPQGPDVAIPAGPTPDLGRAPVSVNRENAELAAAKAVGDRPKDVQPKWWQRALAGAAGFGAGYYNAEGKANHIDPSAAEDALLGGPGNRRRLSDWQGKVDTAQANVGAAKNIEEDWRKNQQLKDAEATQAATQEHQKAQTGLVKQQTATLADEGKRAPKGNFIAVGGGLFNAETREWEKQPVDKTNLTEIDALRAQDLGLKPSQDGKFYLPKEAMSQYIGAQLKPAPAPKDVNAVQLAIRAAGGDPSNPDSITPAIAAKASQILKPPAAGGGGVTLTPEAMDYWAKFAGTTGQLPSLGMGNAGAKAREQILNRAPQMASGDVAANRASNRADAGSLAGMVKMRDAVGAFEGTALANLDLFMKQAKSVIDSGSPLANTPLRSINRNLLGDKDLAAYDAARQVALTEIAKVVNNPSLAGQLSDTGRHEVMGLVPENATLGQIYRVADILKQDMGNRKIFLDKGIAEIKGRMGGQQGGGGGGKISVTAPDGSVHPFDTQAQADAFKKLAGIR